MAHILRETNPRALRHGVMGGAIFENAIIMDIVKTNHSVKRPWQFFYYRDNNQVEVDLILARGSEYMPIEIKLTKSPADRMVSSLSAIQKLIKARQSYLLNTREEPLTIPYGVKAMHWYRYLMEQ